MVKKKKNFNGKCIRILSTKQKFKEYPTLDGNYHDSYEKPLWKIFSDVLGEPNLTLEKYILTVHDDRTKFPIEDRMANKIDSQNFRREFRSIRGIPATILPENGI